MDITEEELEEEYQMEEEMRGFETLISTTNEIVTNTSKALGKNIVQVLMDHHFREVGLASVEEMRFIINPSRGSVARYIMKADDNTFWLVKKGRDEKDYTTEANSAKVLKCFSDTLSVIYPAADFSLELQGTKNYFIISRFLENSRNLDQILSDKKVQMNLIDWCKLFMQLFSTLHFLKGAASMYDEDLKPDQIICLLSAADPTKILSMSWTDFGKAQYVMSDESGSLVTDWAKRTGSKSKSYEYAISAFCNAIKSKLFRLISDIKERKDDGKYKKIWRAFHQVAQGSKVTLLIDAFTDTFQIAPPEYKKIKQINEISKN